ncbi:DUF3169 family protein [Paenibacillus sp. MMS20-IR301]|uniref:DUF3169 family protein n=1 Tax=Paenibacillus sp. MMS20-IR301 TaxID=2895946 RepID=UPI0028E87202|nr:DUF3169 family protein [Paenibacillus sp. MMS20-IR301]WNS45540.1 DUF3169 family protein [Paenibacillus sp. MMS20-IR301]
MNKTKQRINIRGIIMLAVSMLIGGAVGLVFASGIITIPEDVNLKPAVFYEYDVLFGFVALLTLLLTVLTVMGLVRTRRLPDEAKQDSEIENPKERALGRAMQISLYNMIVSLMWTLMSVAHALGPGSRDSADAPFMLTNMIVSLGFMLLSILLLHRVVALYNKHYPDRQMNISPGNSKNSQRELFAKMDEGERWVVYRSAYSSFTVTTIALIIGMTFFAVYSLFFGFAPAPIMVLALILILQQSVYYREVRKYS